MSYLKLKLYLTVILRWNKICIRKTINSWCSHMVSLFPIDAILSHLAGFAL